MGADTPTLELSTKLLISSLAVTFYYYESEVGAVDVVWFWAVKAFQCRTELRAGWVEDGTPGRVEDETLGQVEDGTPGSDL